LILNIPFFVKTKNIFLLILAATQFLPTSGYSLVCESLFKETAVTKKMPVSKFTNELSAEILSVVNLEPILIGTNKPDWRQYQILGDLVWKIEKHLAETKQAQLPEQEIEFLKSSLQEWALRHHQLAKDVTEKASPDLKKYIDVNFAIFKLQQRINELIGLNVFPDYYIQLVAPESVLVKQAEATVSGIKKAIEELYPTTGYKNSATLRKAIQKKSKLYNQTLQLVDSKIVVAIHRPENARFWIPLAGFQNQRVTGSSKGAMLPDYRNQVESQLTFQNQADYSEQSVRYMPNYGEARPDVSVKKYKPNTGAKHYGSDLWIVKKSLYENRASWTPRDSFGQNRVGSRDLATSWDNMFIPWSARELMVPYVHGEKYEGREAETFSPGSIQKFDLKGNFYGSSYFEVQIWGPLTLNDIEAFHFMENPPDRRLFELLTSKGIKIYDERTWPAKIYNGEESK